MNPDYLPDMAAVQAERERLMPLKCKSVLGS